MKEEEHPECAEEQRLQQKEKECEAIRHNQTELEEEADPEVGLCQDESVCWMFGGVGETGGGGGTVPPPP